MIRVFLDSGFFFRSTKIIIGLNIRFSLDSWFCIFLRIHQDHHQLLFFQGNQIIRSWEMVVSPITRLPDTLVFWGVMVWKPEEINWPSTCGCPSELHHCLLHKTNGCFDVGERSCGVWPERVRQKVSSPSGSPWPSRLPKTHRFFPADVVWACRSPSWLILQTKGCCIIWSVSSLWQTQRRLALWRDAVVSVWWGNNEGLMLLIY